MLHRHQRLGQARICSLVEAMSRVSLERQAGAATAIRR